MLISDKLLNSYMIFFNFLATQQFLTALSNKLLKSLVRFHNILISYLNCISVCNKSLNSDRPHMMSVVTKDLKNIGNLFKKKCITIILTSCL